MKTKNEERNKLRCMYSSRLNAIEIIKMFAFRFDLILFGLAWPAVYLFIVCYAIEYIGQPGQ